MNIGVVKILRDYYLDRPIKKIEFTKFEDEKSALVHLSGCSDNEIINPSVKAANNIIKKWQMETYDNLNYYGWTMYRNWHKQVFMCTFSDCGKVTGVYDRNSLLDWIHDYNKPKENKGRTWYYKKYIPESEHHIPYKKRSFYEARYHSPKNGKLRATDYTMELLTYPDEESIQDEVYNVKLPPREYMDWDGCFSRKYYHKDGHICWKNYKKNRKQWMKNKIAHKDTMMKKQDVYEDPWELYMEDEAV